MQLIMLSGNSIRNKEWIYRSREQFADMFDELYVLDYRHWETGGQWIDLEHELDMLRAKVAQFGADYGVFAKSIGTVLAVQALERGIIRPRWLLFCGVPLDYIDQQYPQFAKVVSDAQLPLAVIHNEHDKVGSATAVAKYLDAAFSGRTDYKLIQTPGDTHDYEDYELLRAELARLRD